MGFSSNAISCRHRPWRALHTIPQRPHGQGGGREPHTEPLLGRRQGLHPGRVLSQPHLDPLVLLQGLHLILVQQSS